MKNIFLIILYIIIFTFVSLFISQLPELMKGEVLFRSTEEIVISVFAGIMAGFIVGFYNKSDDHPQR